MTSLFVSFFLSLPSPVMVCERLATLFIVNIFCYNEIDFKNRFFFYYTDETEDISKDFAATD